MNAIAKYKKIFLGVFFMSVVGFCLPVILTGQAGEQKSQPKRERVQRKVRMQLDYYNQNNEEYIIKATVKTKEGRSYVMVEGAVVKFTVITDDGQLTDLGEVVSGADGVAQLTGKFNHLFDAGTVVFAAAIAESKDFKKYSKKLKIRHAFLTVDYVTEDSIDRIKVRCTIADSSGLDIPVENLDIKVYVKRLFGDLPVSTEFNKTDEDGRLEIIFPQNVRGDEDGNIDIVLRVEDHEEYGNLVNSKTISWGIPLAPGTHLNERLLWAAKYNAPVPLVIIVNGVLIAVWGMILYIVLNVVKIFQSGKKERATMQT